MLKSAGCVMIILCATLTGFSMSDRLRQRRDFLKEFLSFLNELKIRLRYNSGDIFQLLSQCGEYRRLEPLLSAVRENKNTSFSELWTKGASLIPKSCGLKKSDITALCGFGSTLGTSDTEGELSHIDLYTEIFTKAFENAGEELKQKSKLYKTMGFFLGTSIALMIV